jgi:sodium/bile acid cotransporter 7
MPGATQPKGWKIIPTLNICIIFLIFGLTLETSELKAALKNVKVRSTGQTCRQAAQGSLGAAGVLQVWVMGIVTILVLTSCTAWLFINVGFQPVEFGMGLAVFACRHVPSLLVNMLCCAVHDLRVVL